MPLQNFMPFSAPAIGAAWLNAVDVAVIQAIGDGNAAPTTPAQVRTNVQAVWTLDLSNKLSVLLGPALVGQSGTLDYAVGTLGGHLRGFISPFDSPFLAPDDGATDATTALTALVAHAAATGKIILWPNIAFVTTASIPLLHTVRHVGPGRIVRGSDIFYPDPTNSQTNQLYVNKITGLSTNDGLSAAQPVDEIQAAVLYRKYYVGRGDWLISPADGTYLTRVDWRSVSELPLRVVGPAWGAVPGVVIDGQTSAANMVTVRDSAGLTLQNVKATNCTDNCIEVIDDARLDARGIHATNAGSSGSGACFYAANNSRATINGLGLLQNSDSSDGVVLAYGGSILSVGQDGTSAADSPAIKDGVRLVNAQHQSLVKLRYAYLDGVSAVTSLYGTYSQSGSHISHENGTADNVQLCYFSTSPAGVLMNESSVTHTGHSALRFYSSVEGVQERPIELRGTFWRCTMRYYAGTLTNATITGTTSKTNIVAAALSLLTKDFNYRGRGFMLRVYGTISGVAGTKTFEINGSSAGSLRSVVAVAADLGNFMTELGCVVLSTASTTVDMLKWGQITVDDRSGQMVSQVTTDNLSVAQDVNVTGELANSADTITTNLVEVWEAGV